MFNYLYILLLILLPFSSGFAQVTQEWVQRYDGPAGSLDLNSGLLLLDDQSSIVYGHSTGIGTQLDMTIIKYSASGSHLWDFRYNGPANGSDQLFSVAVNENREIYGVGNVSDTSAIKMGIVKLNSSGSLQWIYSANVPGYSDQYGQDIIVSPSGNVYACGFAKNLQNNFDLVIMKLSTEGNILWLKTFNHSGNNNDTPVKIFSDANENIFVIGTSSNQSGNENIFYVKYDSAGNQSNTWTYPGVSSRAVSAVMDSSGHIVIAGVKYNISSNFDFLTLRVSPDDSSHWAELYNGPGNHLDYAYKIITDVDCNIYVTGSSRTGTISGTEDVLTIKYDSSGNQLWTNRFDSHPGGSDIGYSLALDRDHNVYIAAAIDRDTNHLIFGTMKIKNIGELEWLRTYEYYHTPEDFPYAVEVDTSNSVYISGISFGGSTDYDITTIKYSQSVNINTISNIIPSGFILHQNYPNPFNPATKIRFEIPTQEQVTLSIYNSLGQLISIPFNSNLPPGSYEYLFDASELPSGIYFYTLQAGEFLKTSKMTLIQ